MGWKRRKIGALAASQHNSAKEYRSALLVEWEKQTRIDELAAAKGLTAEEYRKAVLAAYERRNIDIDARAASEYTTPNRYRKSLLAEYKADPNIRSLWAGRKIGAKGYHKILRAAYAETKKTDIDALAASERISAEEYRKILLAEYAEIGPSWRNDVDTAWRFYALMMAPGLAALYFATTNHAHLSYLGLAGVILIVFALLFYRRQGNRNQIRWNRAHEIERMLGMRHHLNIDEHHIRGFRLWTLLCIFTIAVTVYGLLITLAPGWMGIRKHLPEYRVEGQIQHTHDQGIAMDSVSGTNLELQPDSVAFK